MLLICSGKDTFRSRQKAQELVDAFKLKFDSSGFSIEKIDAKNIDGVLNQTGAMSMFSARRLIRCDGLLAQIKPPQLKTLIKRLKEDASGLILVTLESDEVSEKMMKDLKDVEVHRYEFDLMGSDEFKLWCKKFAINNDVNEKRAMEAAVRYYPDTWMAYQEMMKLSANPDAPMIELDTDEGNVFGAVGKYLSKAQGWRSFLHDFYEEQVPSLVYGQSKSGLKVQDGQDVRLPPFAKNILMRTKADNLLLGLKSGAECLFVSRTGLATVDEIESFYK
ncbi:MAG: hypothetical protein RDU25_06265 [Patescibacteria group bacterium]|nr:hypothetical protein [Patescibacteria group bacterium]